MPIRKDYQPGEFCWIDLNAHDLQQAAAWYCELFGWSHRLQPAFDGAPPYAFFEHGGGVVGGIGQMSDEMKAQGIPPMWNSYIATDDCAATESKVRELGGTVTVSAMDIPGHGKLAFFLDPEGASFAAWQATTTDGPGNLAHEPGGLGWNELHTRDASAASAFYRKLVGWTFAKMPMGDIDYTMVKSADKDVAGMMPMAGPQFDGMPAHWLVYIAVADCAAVAARAAATGGRVNVPPTDGPIGKFSVLSDPQGAVFAIVTLA